MTTSSLTPVLFRRVMGSFATGVTVVTVEREPGQVHGMTANSFTSVSLDPFLVLVCVDQNARLLSYLKNQRRFGLSILRENQSAISQHFAKKQQDPEVESGLGIQYQWTSSGIPVLADALGHLACNVVGEHRAGDHVIFIGEVESLDLGEGQPLLYYRGQYRSLKD